MASLSFANWLEIDWERLQVIDSIAKNTGTCLKTITRYLETGLLAGVLYHAAGAMGLKSLASRVRGHQF